MPTKMIHTYLYTDMILDIHYMIINEYVYIHVHLANRSCQANTCFYV